MDTWATHFTKDESVEFANLPFGEYHLLVKAISSDNIESETIKSLTIEIEPPWYQIWYVKMIFVIFHLVIQDL